LEAKLETILRLELLLSPQLNPVELLVSRHH